MENLMGAEHFAGEAAAKLNKNYYGYYLSIGIAHYDYVL